MILRWRVRGSWNDRSPLPRLRSAAWDPGRTLHPAQAPILPEFLAPLLLLLAQRQLGAASPATPCRAAATAAAAPPTLPRGVVSVTSFGADPSGASDSTAALQRALTAARTQNVTLFVPLGCYVVTDTLNATQPRNGR